MAGEHLDAAVNDFHVRLRWGRGDVALDHRSAGKALTKRVRASPRPSAVRPGAPDPANKSSNRDPSNIGSREASFENSDSRARRRGEGVEAQGKGKIATWH